MAMSSCTNLRRQRDPIVAEITAGGLLRRGVVSCRNRQSSELGEQDCGRRRRRRKNWWCLEAEGAFTPTFPFFVVCQWT